MTAVGPGEEVAVGTTAVCEGRTNGVAVGGNVIGVAVGGNVIAVGVGGNTTAVGVGAKENAVGVGEGDVHATTASNVAEIAAKASPLLRLAPLFKLIVNSPELALPVG